MDKMSWRDAGILWGYLLLHEQVFRRPTHRVLGSMDVRVARYAAELTSRFDCGAVMFSGGVVHSHDLLATTWQEPEGTF